MSQFIEMFGTIDEPKVEVKKLIDVVLSSGQYGSNTSATDYQEGKPRYIRITDINDDGSLNDDIKTAEVIEDKYRLIPGDIVFARTGATVGKTYMHETGNAIYAGYLIKYQMNESKMKPAFMKAFTHSKTYYNWVANSQKVGAQPNISAAQYDNMPVLVPQIEKQEEFLAIYHQADKSGFDGRKSQFIEMFGSVESTKPLADFIEVSFPGEWGQEDKDGSGVKVIRTTNFTNNGKLDLSDVVTRDIDSAKVEKKKLFKGDIILERSGGTNDNPVGRVVYFEEDGLYLFNNFTQLLRCKEGVNSLFIFYSLFNYYQMNKNVIRSMGNKTTGIQNLKMDRYWQIPIADVSIERQKEFETIYRQADKSGSVLQYMIAC